MFKSLIYAITLISMIEVLGQLKEIRNDFELKNKTAASIALIEKDFQ